VFEHRGKARFVIAPGKSDILEYFGGAYGEASLAYVVQPQRIEMPPLSVWERLLRRLPGFN